MGFGKRSRLAIGAATAALCAGAFSSAWTQVITTYTYDDQGQLTTTAADGRVSAYTYDSASNRTNLDACDTELPSRRWEAESLPHAIGSSVPGGWRATVSDGASFMSYGPYATDITSGSYVGVWRAKSSLVAPADTATALTIDVWDATAGVALASRAVPRSAWSAADEFQVFALPFQISAAAVGHAIELRTAYAPWSTVTLDWVGLTGQGAGGAQVWNCSTAWEAKSLPHAVGVAYGDSWSSNGQANYLQYGPYTTAVPAGRRTAYWQLMLPTAIIGDQNLATIDVFDSSTGQVLVSQKVTTASFAKAGKWQRFSLSYDQVTGHTTEIRTLSAGTSGQLVVNRVGVLSTIAALPAAPVAQNSTLTVAYNTPTSGTVSATGVVTSYTMGSQPPAVVGTVAFTGPGYTFTPAPGYIGNTSAFTYLANGPGGSTAGQVNLTVNAPAAPSASDGALNVGYNSSASIAAPVSGPVSGLVIDSNPAKGAVSASGTTLTYTAAWPNYGTDSFTYHATGPGGSSPTRSIIVNIANGTAPVANNGSASTSYNSAVTITYPIGGDYANLALDSAPLHGSLSTFVLTPNVGYQQTYTPQAGWIGGDTWNFHATSPFGNSPARTFTVTTGAPAAPTVLNTSISTAYNTAGGTALPGSGMVSQYILASNPSNGSAVISGGSVIYTPNAGFYGGDSFTYYANGPGGNSNVATVSVNVGVPPAPTAANVSASIPYNTAANVSLVPGGVATTYALTSQPTHGTATAKGGYTVLYNPDTGYSGSDSFTYVVNGPGGQSAAATASITVANPPVTPPPNLQPDSASVHSRNTIDLSPLANDSDPSGYPLTITNVVSNGGGTWTLVNGATQLRFIAPTVGTRANKTVTLTYTVSNGHGGTASSTITVVVETEYYD